MKKYFLYALCMIIQSFFMLGDDNQLLLQAQQYCAKGDFVQALHYYGLVNNKNSVILQNIGSCYFNQHQYTQALLYWKRAYQAAEPEQVKYLCLLEKKALEKLNIKVPSEWYFLVKRFVFMVPLMLLQVIVLILLFVVLLFCIARWRKQQLTSYDGLWLFLLFFGCLLCGLLWSGRQLFLKKNQAIVVRKDVLVYAGPEQTFHVIKTLQQGNTLQVKAKKQGMYNIKQNVLTGWVMSDSIEFIYNDE